MDPATAQLYAALPEIDPALEAGIKVLPRTPSMDVRFQRVLDALKNLALDPGTNVALNGLSSTVGTLNPVIRYLGPNVTVCNYWNYFWAQLADAVSEQTNLGMAEDYTAYILVYVTSQKGKVAVLWMEWPMDCKPCAPLLPGPAAANDDPVDKALAANGRASAFMDSFRFDGQRDSAP